MAFWKQAIISLVLLVGSALGFALITHGPAAIPGLSSTTANASSTPQPGRPAP